MSPWLNRWSLTGLGLMVLVALWALPPRSSEDWFPDRNWRVFRYGTATPEFEAVNKEVRDLARTYQRLVWADSIRGLASGAAQAGVSFLAGTPTWAPAGSSAALTEGIRAQLDSEGVREPAVTIGALIIDSDYGRHPGTPSGWSSSKKFESIVSLDDQLPFCVRVGGDPDQHPRIGITVEDFLWAPPGSRQMSNPLGPCLLHAKYGSPGDSIFLWLRAGGYAFAEGSFPRWVEFRVHPRTPVVRGVGFRRVPYLSVDGTACAGGQRGACIRILRLQASSDDLSYLYDLESGGRSWTSPVGYGSGVVGSLRNFGGVEARLLYDLEEEFGEERFGHFWRSELSFEQAFLAAFREPAEQWLLRWAQERWGEVDVSPRVTMEATFLSFLTIGAFVGLALYRRRRTL